MSEESGAMFNYKDKGSFKVSDKFKQKFTTFIKGTPAITVDGLIALAHVKGIWKMETKIIQFPIESNGFTCICESVVGGYDWDPIEDKIVKVEYSDIADANPTNCTSLTKAAYIRMASTRSLGRALRRYTNIDMVCSEELGDNDISTESMPVSNINDYIDLDRLNKVKSIVMQKGITQEAFVDIVTKTFNTPDFTSITKEQGDELIKILTDYIVK